MPEDDDDIDGQLDRMIDAMAALPPAAETIPEEHPWFRVEGPPPGSGGAWVTIVYGREFEAFWRLARRAGMIDRPDYVRWMQANQGKLNESGWMATAEAADVQSWLFAVWRQERFNDGLRARMLVEGHLLGALRRLRALGSSARDGAAIGRSTVDQRLL